MLRAIKLYKSFGKRIVVRDVTMQVEPGNVVGLLGPNGAGKTTCFYMIVGLVAAGAGQILVDDVDITHQPVNIRSALGVGYLPQDASIFRKLTVEDNIMAILEIRRNLNADTRRELQQQLLEDLGIAHLAKQMGISLSGGERRRAEIARALAAGPRYILLDEPFAGVDPISVIEIQKIVTHLKSLGIGVLITDHNVRETLGICDHAYILNEGAVLAEGQPGSIIDNDEVRKVYLGRNFRL
ncbi:MAG: LPS export ABC transporter ATP-binding protein [Lysobacterales bacterium]